MHTLSQAMLVVAISAFVVAAAGIGRSTSGETDYGRLGALVASAALVVGNIVALLPGAPFGYALALAALTAAGTVALVAVALTQRARRTRDAAWAQARLAAPAQPGRGLYAVPDLGVVDAEIVEDDAQETPRVTSILRDRERVVVTRSDLREVGPDRHGATEGVTYVAAGIVDYVPAHRMPRGTRAAQSVAAFPQRHHGAQATADAAAMRLRVLRAYGATGDLRGRLRSTQA